MSRFRNLLRRPLKAFRYLSVAVNVRLNPQKDVLVIIGAEPWGELAILHPGYRKCYVFEANPSRFERLQRRYGRHKHIHLHHCAVTDYNGEISFNISSNNDGASSSVGTFNEEWQKTLPDLDVRMVQQITVPCINLMDFCLSNGIEHIDDYISDIQGMDLQVLRTMATMLEQGRIGSVKCEVALDAYGNVYSDLPDNSESGFAALLGNRYRLVARGYGLLSDGQFDTIPETAWEMDCKWRLL
jgi:FkbM family methyltransferase